MKGKMKVKIMKTQGHPIFSAFYSMMSSHLDETMFGKQSAFFAANFEGLRVLEVGCGTGINFTYYPNSAQVVAIEPDPHMLRRARACLKTIESKNIEVINAGAESLPFGDEEFDAVLVTLVLCTIPNERKALQECKRVLRPGGKLYFLEHVQAHSSTWQKIQNFVNPLWNKLAGGCNLNRDSLSLIKSAGFEIEVQKSKKRCAPWLPFIYGVARKL